ncbi:MAG: UDP-glucose 4-epimerase GalE [Cyclobacteriaceae bacterium]|nr:UDP-glucose 4-epimerase GalE [Cyclobacteriaceae bacterium]
MAGKIIVTGGTGYIGSHTTIELFNQGFEVVIIDDLSNSKEEMLDRIEKISGKRPIFYHTDLKDKNAVAEIFRAHEISAVIHFAASKAVGESVEKPLFYYKNNLLGIINLLECMTDNNVGSFIFSSSCTVYGQPDELPVTENSPIKVAASPYGNTKQIGEEIISDTMAVTENMNAISLRYFNPIGAHDSGLIGELPQGIPNNLIPYLLKVAAGELEKLSVFGDDYDTTDGTAVRDYIHVVDLAKAHVIALKRLLEKKNTSRYEVFNLGTGTGYTVLEIIKGFEKVTGTPLNYVISPRRPGDVEKIYADTNLANSVLGWKAERGLDNMLETAWKWQCNM